MASIIIPTPLRKFTRQKSIIQLAGDKLENIHRELFLKFPGIKPILTNDKNEIKSNYKLFIDNQEVNTLEKTVNLSDQSVIAIIPRIQGGL